ncbi:MAG: hypothetical protein HW404_198 [Anaerolineales bacterium]|jgi:hypothetical protein|nr:hypothetical protein [Anaerolineales bacterium]
MARYLVEVPHDNRKEACEMAVRAFLETGSHFVTGADWGCSDGEHKAWMIVDVGSKDEALSILPPLFRNSAKVTSLERFTLDRRGGIIGVHPG